MAGTYSREEAAAAGKTDFTEEETEKRRKGVTRAGLVAATSDRSFFGNFKAARAMAKRPAGGRDAQSQLVRDLASEHGTGFGFTESASEVETGATEALHASVQTLQVKAPDELEAYRSFVLDIAQSVGKAAGGG